MSTCASNQPHPQKSDPPLSPVIGAFTGRYLTLAQALAVRPTGPAAKRINEATGFEAKTIHRLLDEVDPGAADSGAMWTIRSIATCSSVDETSMVDVLLMHVGYCGQDCNNDDPDCVYSRQRPGQIRPRRPLGFFCMRSVCVCNRMQGFNKSRPLFLRISN